MIYQPYPQNLIDCRLNSYQKFFSSFFLKKLFDYYSLFEFVFCAAKISYGKIKIETHLKEESYAILLSKNFDLILGSKKISYYMKGWKEKETFISNENHFGSELIISFSFNPELGGKPRLYNKTKKFYNISSLIFYKIKEFSISIGFLFFLTIFPELFQKRSWYKIKKENTIYNIFSLFENVRKKEKILENLNGWKDRNIQVFFFVGGKSLLLTSKIPVKKKILWINLNIDENSLFLLNKSVASKLKYKLCEEISKKTIGFLFYETLYESFLGKNYSSLKEVLGIQGFFVFKTPYEGNSIENFLLNLTKRGLISKKKIYPEFEFSPITERHSLENFELTFNFASKKKKLERGYFFWSNFNLFSHENFAKFFFLVSENFFFDASKKKFSLLLSSGERFLLISKFFGQVKIKQVFFQKEVYKKFSGNSLLKNLVRFSSSGKARNYSNLGKIKI